MKTQTQADLDQILYPDDDGLPMSDNTRQFQWIVTLQGNLDALYRDNPDVFVAGNLLWYAVEGQPALCRAPEAMVVFGRPKGYRGSYRQWQEGGVAPQAVFEVLSPSNEEAEMGRKFAFYDAYGVEEYYLYDPDAIELSGWRRQQGRLQPILQMDGWVSPRLGIRFDLSGDELVIFRPDGAPFLTYLEQAEQRVESQQQAAAAQQQAAAAQQQAAAAQQQAAAARKQADQERERAERLAAMLRALGVDPEA
jgi:Uma2 family endonuclease